MERSGQDLFWKHMPTLPHTNLNTHVENIRFHSEDGKMQGPDYIIQKLHVNILQLLQK